jgi:hypothetical protein
MCLFNLKSIFIKDHNHPHDHTAFDFRYGGCCVLERQPVGTSTFCAFFDRKANRTGSMVAFFVSLFLRGCGGEPLFDIPALVHYPEWWPTRVVAAGAGLILLPLVSRLSTYFK